MSMDLKSIPPEQAGIPSEAIMNYLRVLEENHVNLHGFMMLRGKQIIAECYYPPFDKDYVHRMYSISKSFTSIAIGFLVEEEKLKIDDFICDYFKDKLDEKVHPYIRAITIRDMLKMATAHRMTTYKRYDGDWVKSFFVMEPSHMPGTIFSYDTSSSHVLAALVERLSGTSILDYLKDKLFGKLGFSSDVTWLQDPYGVSQGGTGFFCTMRDLAKVAYVCMNEGVLDGEQLIPKEYIKEATKKQISTDAQSATDEQFGYGYQIWKTRHDGFAFFGMGGQLAVCFPKQNFIYLTTADTQGSQGSMQLLYEAFYQNIYPYVEKFEHILPDNLNGYHLLKDKLKNLKTAVVSGKHNTKISEIISGKVYLMDENSMGLSTLKILMNESSGKLIFKNKKGEYEIPFGFDNYEVLKPSNSVFEIRTCGAFVRENELHIKSLLLGECFANVNAVFSFKENYVTVNSKRAAENMLHEFDGIACGHYVLEV